MPLSEILQVAIGRVADKGVGSAGVVPAFAGKLKLIEDGLPNWWNENDNVMFAPEDCLSIPVLQAHPGLPPPANARVVLGCSTMPDELLLWGDSPIVILGSRSRFPSGRFCCGGNSTIIVGDGTSSTWSAQVDSRNGGLVLVGPDGLWATRVQLNTDDMHAIRDPQGRRLNSFGGSIIIGEHVWLAHEALILGGANIGHQSVVGARSVVTRELPGRSVCVGSPAKCVKTDVTWEFEDLP